MFHSWGDRVNSAEVDSTDDADTDEDEEEGEEEPADPLTALDVVQPVMSGMAKYQQPGVTLSSLPNNPCETLPADTSVSVDEVNNHQTHPDLIKETIDSTV